VFVPVLDFAGDAIICFFPSTTTNRCLLNALHCAMEIKDHRTVEFVAHVGISYGEICVALLGGHDGHWSCLISGDSYSELSDCIRESEAGEAVMTKSCYDAIGPEYTSSSSAVQATCLPSGRYKLIKTDTRGWSVESSRLGLVCDPHLSCFVPSLVRNAIAAGSFESFNEIREVTTLFLRLDNFSSQGNAVDLLSLQPSFLGMQRILHDNGGHLRQFLVDDKGCIFIGVWGVPGASYPNNCSRALNCAATIAKLLRTLGEDCSIGISTGVSYCGTMGSMTRKDYVVLSDSVNLAARLMGKANRRIILDEVTFKRLPSSISVLTTRAEKMMLKGVVEPILPYVYTSDSLPRLPSLDELDSNDDNGNDIIIHKSIEEVLKRELDNLYHQGVVSSQNMTSSVDNDLPPPKPANHATGPVSSPRQVRFVILEGAPGMGKSTVASYFRRKSQRRNVRCVYVQAKAEDESAVYSVVRKIVFSLTMLNTLDAAAQDKKMIQILRDVFPSENEKNITGDLLPVLQHALQLKSVEAAPASLFMRFGNATLHQVLLYLLSVRRTTLVIDDAHFCDKLSIRELGAMLNANAPVLALLTYRVTGDDCEVVTRTSSNSSLYMLQWTPSRASSPRGGSPRSTPVKTPRDTPKSKSKSTASKSGSKASSRFFFPDEENNDSATTASSNDTDISTTPTYHMTRYQTAEALRILSAESSCVSPRSPGFKKTPQRSKVKRNLTLSKYGIVFSDNKKSLQQHRNCVSIELPALDEAEVRRVLKASVDMDNATESHVSDEVVSLVHAVTMGNPYWVNSIARFIRASGVDRFTHTLSTSPARSGKGETSSSISIEEVHTVMQQETLSPATTSFGSSKVRQQLSISVDVEDVVVMTEEDHIRSLSQHVLCHQEMFSVEERTICKYASIVGYTFHMNILAAILPAHFKGLDHLEASLRILSEEGILYRIPSHDGCAVFEFQNELIRRTLYDTVLPSEAARIHRSIAEAIETQFKGRLEPQYAILSYHYAMCDEDAAGPTLQYTVMAAEQSFGYGDCATGLTYLRHASTLVKNESQVRTVLEAAEVALQDMNPRSSLTIAAHFSKLKAFAGSHPVPAPFTSEDHSGLELFVSELRRAHKLKVLNGHAIVSDAELKSHGGRVLIKKKSHGGSRSPKRKSRSPHSLSPKLSPKTSPKGFHGKANKDKGGSVQILKREEGDFHRNCTSSHIAPAHAHAHAHGGHSKKSHQLKPSHRNNSQCIVS
jgi:class 3 adenylate cyclase